MPVPLPLATPDAGVSEAARIVQTALTPIFLLTGIGTLLGLFNTRLARVSDQIKETAELQRGDPRGHDPAVIDKHAVRLRRRVFALDASVVFGAIGGAATCLSVLILFLGSVRDAAIAGWLIGLFGSALACTVASLAAFLVDSLLAWHGMRTDGPVPGAGDRRGG